MSIYSSNYGAYNYISPTSILETKWLQKAEFKTRTVEESGIRQQETDTVQNKHNTTAESKGTTQLIHELANTNTTNK